MYTIEEFDKNKSKVMNYIMYKKRTEQEVKNKFYNTIEQTLLSDIIEYIKKAGYLNNKDYIERSINEYRALKKLSLKEIIYKLYSKGIEKYEINEYISNNIEELEQYEISSANSIISKKAIYKDNEIMNIEEIKNELMKKGYKEESIKNAIKLL